MAILFSAIVISCLILTACSSVPPGKPPLGPIVTPEIKISVFDRKAATNYMITSIATRCAPVACAGASSLFIVNDFAASGGKVNNMPMELWQSLIKMKLIQQGSEKDSKTLYKLVSEIKELTSSGKETKYYWELRLLSLKENTEVWKDSVEFVLSHDETANAQIQ